MKYKDIKNYLNSIENMDEKIIALRCFNELISLEKNNNHSTDDNVRILLAFEEIKRIIGTKKYLKQYENMPKVIKRIETLYLLCNNYMNNFDIKNNKKKETLIETITCLEALLRMNLSFPDYAEYYLEQKLKKKGGIK